MVVVVVVLPIYTKTQNSHVYFLDNENALISTIFDS